MHRFDGVHNAVRHQELAIATQRIFRLSQAGGPETEHTEECTQLFLKALRTSNFVPPDELDDWVDSLTSGNEDLLLALIYTLLLSPIGLPRHRFGIESKNRLVNKYI